MKKKQTEPSSSNNSHSLQLTSATTKVQSAAKDALITVNNQKTVTKIKKVKVIRPLRGFSCKYKNKKKIIKVSFKISKGKTYFLTITNNKGKFVEPLKQSAKKKGKKAIVSVKMKKSKIYIVQVYEKTSTKSGEIKRIQCIGAEKIKIKK